MEDRAKFCTGCGSSLLGFEEPKKKSSRKWVVLGVSGFLLSVAIGIGFFYVNENRKVAKMERFSKQIEQLAKDYEQYMPTNEERQNFDQKVEEFQNLELKGKNYEKAKKLYKEVERYEEQTKDRVTKEYQTKLEQLKKVELPEYASNNERKEQKEYASKMEKQIEEGNFIEANQLEEDWNTFIESTFEKKTGYEVEVLQADYSEFPKIKLYLSIENEYGVVNGITKEMFYVSDSDNPDKASKIKIEKVLQLNEQEALNVNLVVDTSGSMGESSSSYRTYFDDAKDFIKQFIGQVQFDAGDKVKVSPFHDYVEDRYPFSSDKNQIYHVLDEIEPYGGTLLYDTLIYSIQNVATQTGAKCVIAFTDGFDNCSSQGVQDVIDTACYYQVPVYIVKVGFGDEDGEAAQLRRICEATGGDFYERNGFGDIFGIYETIYKDLKQYYILEYQVSEEADMAKKRYYNIYIRNDDMGGEYSSTYVAKDTAFSSLLWNYADALAIDKTNREYRALQNYCETKSPIEKEQKSYVTDKNASLRMSLMGLQITNVVKEKEDLYKVSTEELYVITDQRKVYQSIRKQLTSDQLNYYDSQFDKTDQVLVNKSVFQRPSYYIKRSSDGTWKMYQYFDGSYDYGIYDIRYENIWW